MQVAALCGVHCINTLLQGPFFSELDLAQVRHHDLIVPPIQPPHTAFARLKLMLTAACALLGPVVDNYQGTSCSTLACSSAVFEQLRVLEQLCDIMCGAFIDRLVVIWIRWNDRCWGMQLWVLEPMWTNLACSPSRCVGPAALELFSTVTCPYVHHLSSQHVNACGCHLRHAVLTRVLGKHWWPGCACDELRLPCMAGSHEQYLGLNHIEYLQATCYHSSCCNSLQP